jgi:hypothetical protein
LASPLVRLQSREGTEVVNQRHFNLRVEDSLTRRLLQLLDGSRDREALLGDLVSVMRSGDAAAETDKGAMTKSPGEGRYVLAAELEKKLGELAEMGLLVA